MPLFACFCMVLDFEPVVSGNERMVVRVIFYCYPKDFSVDVKIF